MTYSRRRSPGARLWSSAGHSSFRRGRTDHCPSLPRPIQAQCQNKYGVHRSFDTVATALACSLEKLTQLIGADDKRFGSRPLRFVNDVDVLDGRYIFFTDSDWLYPRKDFVSVLLQSNPRGRYV